MTSIYHLNTQNQLNIAYNHLNSIEDLQFPQPKTIRKLTIIHSHLQSLRGIEKFTQLISLNVKFNNLAIAQQILLIPNKEILTQLNLQGNTIQYYSLCTFASLKSHGFKNLLILNNNDYSKWGKNRKKAPSTVMFSQKFDKMQKSMTKTLKRTVRNNVIQKYKFNTENIEPQQDYQITSRHSIKQQTTSSNQKVPLKQISLANVHLVKSVKPSSPEKPKGPQLVIYPIQFQQSQVSHIPITQPTATFASQKQKENAKGMPFRRVVKCDKSIINEVLEVQNLQTEEQQIFELSQYINNNCGRQSISRMKTINLNNKSVIDDQYDNYLQHQYDVAEGFFLRNLLQKSWKRLKNFKSENLPLQRHYI